MLPIESLLGAVKQAGLKAQELSTFYKVAAGPNAIYIAKTQKVSRVDLSGFTVKGARRVTAATAEKMHIGRVRGILNPETESFANLLGTLKQLAVEAQASAPTPTKRPAKRTPKAPVQTQSEMSAH
jgi:hypothetical protein